ncbi:hypothetical protein FJT64_007922 [Amphibalanus amphitrite]|uniref:Uncharacterized protein n=1 Tax=Amphibalanus amphitrite TaxID=1232801 RepID=A0A6A4VRZ9_AMPAM|nr:hypothetical protein FJT64_007922 [Amphibalanus amphitrite]
MSENSDSVSAESRRNDSRAAGEDEDITVIDRQTGTATERQSVSDLVRNFGDSFHDVHKRDRSESGDSVPAGKRGARERGGGEPGRSPSVPSTRSLKESLDAAVDGLESRLMVSLSRELHDFRELLMAEIVKLNERVKDLEQHVEARDSVIDQLTDDLRRSRDEVSALQSRAEEAEINSRLPCLILSGGAMAPRHAPRLEPPLGAPP